MEQGKEHTASTENVRTPLLGKSQETQATAQQVKEKVDLDTIPEIEVVQTKISVPERVLQNNEFRDFDETFGKSSTGEKIDFCEEK